MHRKRNLCSVALHITTELNVKYDSPVVLALIEFNGAGVVTFVCSDLFGQWHTKLWCAFSEWQCARCGRSNHNSNFSLLIEFHLKISNINSSLHRESVRIHIPWKRWIAIEIETMRFAGAVHLSKSRKRKTTLDLSDSAAWNANHCSSLHLNREVLPEISLKS